jgi:hypothetical protein
VLKNCVVGVINGFSTVNEDSPHITLNEVTDTVANATGTSEANEYHAKEN